MRMTAALKKIAFVVGMGLLIVSIFWSQDGFNFRVAGDAGGQVWAVRIGWFLGLSVTVVQFVFSTNYRDLNPTLIGAGILAYVYSIYTNMLGITHFQGHSPDPVMAWILGFVMDGVPEPLIAWSLGESLTGDFVGNIGKAIFGEFNKVGNNSNNSQKSHRNPENGQDSPKVPPFIYGNWSRDTESRRKVEEDRNPTLERLKNLGKRLGR